ncbi:MAG: nuclear transport factor 2 family protein [Saprospiraceae bacterium]
MKSITFLLPLIFILLSCEQQKSIKKSVEVSADKALIEQTIENYFTGWITNDTTKIGSAMDITCQLKNIKDNKVVIYDRATYLGFFKPGPPKENSHGKILSIDITGPIAAAKVKLETPKGLFTDYFNLIKLENQWYIVDKISTYMAKE